MIRACSDQCVFDFLLFPPCLFFFPSFLFLPAVYLLLHYYCILSAFSISALNAAFYYTYLKHMPNTSYTCRRLTSGLSGGEPGESVANRPSVWVSPLRGPPGLKGLAWKVPPRILPWLLLAGWTLPVWALWHPAPSVPPVARGAAAAPLVLGFSMLWKGFFFNQGSVAQNALLLPGDSISKKSVSVMQRGVLARVPEVLCSGLAASCPNDITL